ncbi:hypothetical protein HPB52_005246 [Rhipicephalus sanguineus]|uniref:Hexosyltransferase n=1 Tax=Rhipicephalus sanguineus TaxID=34632 RepID=A0A9D4SQ12_RHISA|nr:hypothetical protein HPB52_005246 [Rhipicephalus sanguineus]
MLRLRTCFCVLIWLAELDAAFGATLSDEKQGNDELTRSAATATESQPLSAQTESDPPVYRRVLPAPDWFIRRECRERLDVFFAVTSEASDWSSRSDIRGTVLEGRVKRTFRWVGAFVVEEPRERLVAKWLEVEGDAEGDLIVLPPASNGIANATHALRNVIRWASEHCTEARYVIMLADDMVVHPMLLHRLLRRVDETEMGAVHCDIRGSFGLTPGTDFVAFAARHKFLAGGFDLYCAGSVVLASLKLLKDLDRALMSAGSKTVSALDEPQERDRHGTVKIRNVAFGGISNVSFDANWNSTFVKLSGGTTKRKLDRYALWYSALWKDVLWSKPSFRKLFRGAQHANDVFGKGVQE